MLEICNMRLFEARSVGFEAKGSSNGIGRDEILGAAAIATKAHEIGNRIVLAEMGDEHSLKALAETVAAIVPTLKSGFIAVLMGRPLPKQLEDLIYKHPRYKRERRRSQELRIIADNLAERGKTEEAKTKVSESKSVLEAARVRVREEIMRTGKYPACLGTGLKVRKGDKWPVCQGLGTVPPNLDELRKTLPHELYERFTDALYKFTVERQE